MLFDRHHFYFFGNREITSLYVTLGLLSFAEGLISIFVPIYFWELGYPLWQILFFYFIQSLYFIVCTFLFLGVIRNLSDKMMMFLGIPFAILYYFGLTLIGETPILFYFLPLGAALHMLLFNVGYHISFSGTVDDGYVGREVGTRYMLGSLVQFSAPFIGGVLIASLGFQYTFIVAIAVLLLSVLPLFFFQRRIMPPEVNVSTALGFLTNKTLRPFNLSGAGYAAEVMVGRIIWPLFIFLTIGSIQDFGGVISAGLLFGAVITFLTGFLSDAGKRRRMLAWASGLYSAVWALRPFFAGAVMVVGSHIAGQIVNASLMVSWSSQYYKIARSISEPTLFILSREMLYHISRILFLPVLMALAFFMPEMRFYQASFIIAAGLTLFFLFANKQHSRNIIV